MGAGLNLGYLPLRDRRFTHANDHGLEKFQSGWMDDNALRGIT